MLTGLVTCIGICHPWPVISYFWISRGYRLSDPPSSYSIPTDLEILRPPTSSSTSINVKTYTISTKLIYYTTAGSKMFQRAIATAPRAAARALSTPTRAFGPSSARIATPVIANRIANGRRQYHEKVLDHYSRPRNVGSMSKADTDVGTGLVGAPACGDVMKLQIRVDPTNNTISDVKFKTFGCGSAIASSSYLTELVRGMTLEEAGRVRNTEIAKELCLPPVKRKYYLYHTIQNPLLIIL